MNGTAFLFPGQGSQFVGMGASFVQSSQSAKARVEEACDALGFDIWKLITGGPEQELALTANTQPAILLVSALAYDALMSAKPVTPIVVAGHSLGEFSACWSAGVFSLRDAIRLVRKRGELMQSAVPPGEGAMAAVIGLTPDAVAEACAEAGGSVAPANFNSPEQTVIAGARADVEKAMEILKSRGAKKIVKLQVSAPFHTNLMKPAQDGLVQFMEMIEFNDPEFPVIRNVDAGVSRTAAEVKDGLLRQVTGCVRWVDSMRALPTMGVSKALELGPGKVLAGLMKRIDKTVQTVSIGSAEELLKAVETV
jgi:[acyl-carrier-protein] S-malonyltransferase